MSDARSESKSGRAQLVKEHTAFAPGETLIMKPQDADDPEALAHAGECCRFLRYAHGAVGSVYVFVQFAREGRPFCFRQADVRRAAEATAAEEKS